MAVLDPIVKPAAHFATIEIADLTHRCRVRSKAVRHDLLSLAMTLQRLLQKRQSRIFVAFLRNITLENLTLMVDRTPEIMLLAADLHHHLIKVPAPVPESAHTRNALAPDIGCEHRSKSVPPAPQVMS